MKAVTRWPTQVEFVIFCEATPLTLLKVPPAVTVPVGGCHQRVDVTVDVGPEVGVDHTGCGVEREDPVAAMLALLAVCGTGPGQPPAIILLPTWMMA